ncbi:glycoside hydrolase family 95 protein [Flavivirga algicola]|uniref:Glycoside hydrolase family 95 protein n=1 Tax=Flavivirga algicola TaxID=2729136 RepID=A0ABX1S1W3_9FLAO|nr:glycoside hydrolase family 95 protein [Flavivirga algicola]NMH89862.1 glycoside hydrolase family 95 protein [Flavivirga algicola]
MLRNRRIANRYKVLGFKVVSILIVMGSSPDLLAQENLEMWYTAPAAQWKESLPIGNGRMGTMIAGNITSDTLVMNEETVWTGGIHNYINVEANQYLDEIRQLILDRKYDEALKLGDKHMIGTPRKLQRYQPLGKLIFDFGHEKANTTDYKRSLSLNKALVSVSYKNKGYTYTREIFASHPDDVIVMRFTTNNSEGIKFKLKHTSEHKSVGQLRGDTYILKGQGSEGQNIKPDIRFESRIEILGKGTLNLNTDEKGSLEVKGGKELVLLYTAATNYKSYQDVSGDPEEKCDHILADAKGKSYKSLFKRHFTDYKALFDRVVVNFGNSKSYDIPTNKLIEQAKSQQEPLLDALFYQMGRYIIIAGSRKGTQPLNLQGIWNDSMNPPWGCKWTLNINLPMNYWMVEASNLEELNDPLFQLLYDLEKTGTKVAKEHYEARGFVAHHNTDLWRAAAPVDGANWGLWTFGGAWLTRHLWESYQYSQDKEFLKKVYPVMKNASLFFFDFLSEGNQGYLVTSPSVSFEQSYTLPNGKHGRLCEGPTMDNQILRDLFTNCYRAGKILEDDEVFLDSLSLIKNRLKPTTIDTNTGRLMEWAWPAKQKMITGQNASLWGVHPGYEINYIETPELAAAAEKTLSYSDAKSVVWQSVGSWMSGTKSNFWTRLYKGNEAYHEYEKIVEKNLFENLFVSFYPKKYFMADGNLGVAASFNEMLVQSHRINKKGNTIIDLLPAIPDVWKDGSIKGIRTRGGFELNLSWKAGKLETLKILSKVGNTCDLVYGGKTVTLKTKAGKSYLFDEHLKTK